MLFCFSSPYALAPALLFCGFKNYLALLYINVSFLLCFSSPYALAPNLLFCGFEIYLARLYTCTGYKKTQFW